MVTDDERREVAERLRGLRRGAHNVTQLNHGPTWSLAWCVLGDGLDECGTGDWFERMCARLADLIEPPHPDAMASYKGWRAEVYDPDGVLASPSNVAADLVRAHADGKGPGIDRGALLKLAEDVEEAAAMAVAMDASKWAKLLADMMLDIARRIREALGVGK